MATFSSYAKNIAYGLFILIMIKPILFNLKKNITEYVQDRTKVGIISLSGPIMKSSCFVKHLHAFFKDPEIKAIVIKMDSPGGAAGSSQAIYEEIKFCKKKYPKPVITFVENICASGGYYIACTTDHIIATPSAFMGSIGVYIAYPELKEFINQCKVTYNITQAGEYKTIGNPLAGKLTSRQQELLNFVTQDTYQQFIEDVSSSRPQLTLAQQKEWAEGKIFTGRQALKLKLIDELGSFSAVEEAVKKHAAINNEIVWIKRPKKVGMIAQALGASEEDQDEDDNDSFVGSCINHIMSYLEQKTSFGIRT